METIQVQSTEDLENVANSSHKENKQPRKNTDCQACLNFRLENTIAKYKNVREERENFPLWRKFSFNNNHALNRAEYFSYMSVSQDKKNACTDIFLKGMTPSVAHSERRCHILAKL